MNFIELLKLDPSYQLSEKINSYGRNLFVSNGETMIDNGFAGDPSTMDYIVDFKDCINDGLDAGCETYFRGKDNPVRCCIQDDRSVNLARIKKLIPTIFKTIRTPIDVLYIYYNWKHYLDFIHSFFRDIYYPDVKFYSQPIRELYRAMSGFYDVVDKLRDIMCSILEGDTSYRYPFQDVLSELNKDNLLKNSIKEIKRLVDLLFKREGNHGEHRFLKFKRIMWLVYIYLFFNRRLLKTVRDILLHIDLYEIGLNEDDVYWAKVYDFSYDFNYGKKEDI